MRVKLTWKKPCAKLIGKHMMLPDEPFFMSVEEWKKEHAENAILKAEIEEGSLLVKEEQGEIPSDQLGANIEEKKVSKRSVKHDR